jgi:hypothetical protein
MQHAILRGYSKFHIKTRKARRQYDEKVELRDGGVDELMIHQSDGSEGG